MKNPFIAMAVMAASMAAAYQEDKARTLGYSPLVGSRRSRWPGRHNPAGSKLIRQFYRAKHGRKDTLLEAQKWYGRLK